MDFFTLFIGIVIGLLVGFPTAWYLATSIANDKKSAKQSTEAELKALLALRAQNHVETSIESIRNIETELSRMLNNVKEYEQSLVVNTKDYSTNTFFGEHASMFLRNSNDKPSHSIESNSGEFPPRDFANSGSGVFVGSPVKQTLVTKEKSNK